MIDRIACFSASVAGIPRCRVSPPVVAGGVDTGVASSNEEIFAKLRGFTPHDAVSAFTWEPGRKLTANVVTPSAMTALVNERDPGRFGEPPNR